MNQFSGERVTIELPKMLAGDTSLEQNQSLDAYTPVVDEVMEITGVTCTISQRMNEGGDMLRVATNVEIKERTASSTQVSESLTSVAAIAEEASASAEEVAASAEELSTQIEEVTAVSQSTAAQAEEMRRALARFRLNEEKQSSWAQENRTVTMTNESFFVNTNNKAGNGNGNGHKR